MQEDVIFSIASSIVLASAKLSVREPLKSFSVHLGWQSAQYKLQSTYKAMGDHKTKTYHWYIQEHVDGWGVAQVKVINLQKSTKQRLRAL